jgi:hypothetical protein
VLGVDPVLAAHDRLGQMRAQRLLAARSARAQHVERHPGDDGRQPRAQVLDLVGLRPAEAQPGLLDGVVGLAGRAEHPVGHRAQVATVGLEAVGERNVVVHGHILSLRSVKEVTNAIRSM